MHIRRLTQLCACSHLLCLSISTPDPVSADDLVIDSPALLSGLPSLDHRIEQSGNVRNFEAILIVFQERYRGTITQTIAFHSHQISCPPYICCHCFTALKRRGAWSNRRLVTIIVERQYALLDFQSYVIPKVFLRFGQRCTLVLDEVGMSQGV